MKLDPREARAVLHQCDFGALATQSAKLAGFPFVSHVPMALDGAGRPVMLLSNLAEHTRNLSLDPRASLMATLPGPDPQAQARLTLLGEVAPFDAPRALVDRYLRYHPEAATFLGFGDFRFFRLSPVRIRLVGGFARAGWIEAADWKRPALGEAEEAELLAALASSRPVGWTVLGLDWEGLDVRNATGSRLRLSWAVAPATPDTLAEQARHTLASVVAV